MMGVREMERFVEQWQMDARDLRRRMIRSPTPRERERWYALLLLAQGWTGSAVAEALERDPHTIGRWAAAFGEGGPAALIFEQSGGSPPPSAVWLPRVPGPPPRAPKNGALSPCSPKGYMLLRNAPSAVLLRFAASAGAPPRVRGAGRAMLSAPLPHH